MTRNSAQDHKQAATTKNIRLADELERLQSRISGTRAYRDVDCPEKQRVVAARRTKLSFAW